MMMMGAFLGPEVIVISFLPGSIFGVVLGTIHSRVAKTPHFPFGPSLALAGFGMAFFGETLIAAIDWGMKTLRALPPQAVILFNGFLFVIAIWMILRIRKRASEYERMIDEDYNNLE